MKKLNKEIPENRQCSFGRTNLQELSRLVKKSEDSTERALEKPWCVFGEISWQDFGKIVVISDDEETFIVRPTKNAKPLTWIKEMVTQYSTLKEAIIEVHKNDEKRFDDCNSIEYYLEEAERRFPGQLKKEGKLYLAIKSAEFYTIL